MTATENTPRVWVGCLACYNAGNLRGEWIDAVDAGETTPEDIHHGPTSHEELWCMDHENLPISGECSPMEAAKIAQALTDAAERIPMAAALAYARQEDVDDWDTFARTVEDRYMGTYDSFRDYADELAGEELAAHGISDDHPLARYFDYESYARELAWDYAVIRDSGDVHVFTRG